MTPTLHENTVLVLQHLQADRCSANLFLSIQAGRRQYTSQFRRVPKGSHIHVQLRKLIMFGQDNFKRWLDSKNHTLCEAAFLFLPAFARELSLEQIGDFLDYVECWMQSFSLSDNIFDIRERIYTAVLQLYSILPISTEVRARCERILCLCVAEAIEAVRSRLKDLALIQLKPDYDLLQQLSLLQIIDEQDVQAIDAIIKSIMATPSGEIDKGIASFLDFLGNESAAVRQFACTKFVRIVHLLPPVVLERVITEINDLDVLECKLLARILNVYTKGASCNILKTSRFNSNSFVKNDM